MYWVCMVGFANGGGEFTGVFSMSSCQNLPPCPEELLPADSKKDVLMAKAEPVRSGGNAPVIAQLRERGKRKKYCTDVITAREEMG